MKRSGQLCNQQGDQDEGSGPSTTNWAGAVQEGEYRGRLARESRSGRVLRKIERDARIIGKWPRCRSGRVCLL